MSAPPPWLELDRQHAWHPYTQHGLDLELLPVASAKGAVLKLTDGRELIDAISSWWSILHGHGEPRLIQALQEQAEQLDHVLYAGCSHEPAARLAAELVELAATLADDTRSLQRVFYSDNGSTAIEVALKAAYQYHLRRGEDQRRVFLALEGAYHGDTFGAMAVGEPTPFFQEFGPLLFSAERVPVDADALTQRAAELGDQLAAIILEPGVQGAAGMRFVPPVVTRAAREAADAQGALMIADEVMTGFGRTGTVFACEQAGVCPDLMAIAKGLTGGIMPLSATLATEQIYAAFLSEQRDRAFFHGHTFTAHPLGCAVARASMELLKERNTPRRFQQQGLAVAKALRELLGQQPWGDQVSVRQLGGIVAAEWIDQDETYTSLLSQSLRTACMRQEHVLLRPLGNVLYALPPACLEDLHVNFIANAIEACFASVIPSARSPLSCA